MGRMLLLAGFSAAVAGCSAVRVRVEARVTPDDALRRQLVGPRYVIRAPDEETEASLAFQEFAETLAHALEMRRPELQRVKTSEPAEFAILLHVTVTDRGTGIASYPVYGHQYGRAFGPRGSVYFHSYGVVGTQVQSVHLGYERVAFATAYIQDPTTPGGRRVLWEAMAASAGEDPAVASAMPYLALGLSSLFGMSTEGSRLIRFSRDDEEVDFLRSWITTGMPPASRPAEPDEDG